MKLTSLHLFLGIWLHAQTVRTVNQSLAFHLPRLALFTRWIYSSPKSCTCTIKYLSCGSPFSPYILSTWLNGPSFQVHVLPKEILGRSTFGLSMWLLRWLPISLVDRFLLLMSHLMLGNTAKHGLVRPKLGPLQLKNLTGKTPVLDVGTLSKIRCGDIKVSILVN